MKRALDLHSVSGRAGGAKSNGQAIRSARAGPMIIWAVTALLVSFSPVAAGFVLDLPERLQDAVYVDVSECSGCHEGRCEELGNTHLASVHGRIRDYRPPGCPRSAARRATVRVRFTSTRARPETS